MNSPRILINTNEVKRGADLLALASSITDLGSRPVASTGGGEWAGPCPFCQGRDRFRVQPNHQPYPIWLCRHCTEGKWKNAIDFGRRAWPGLSFTEVCERLMGGNLPMTSTARQEPEPQLEDQPPVAVWQTHGLDFVQYCEHTLFAPEGARALAWLHKRGLNDETLKHFRVGFHSTDDKVNGHYTDKGVTIPGFHGDTLWYVKIRRRDSHPKYRNIKGSNPAMIYNADALVRGYPALWVEGEFDTMLAWQEFHDLIPTATIGAADNRPDLAAWGHYFRHPNKAFILPDTDKAGEKAARFVAKYSRNPFIVGLPAGYKDLTEYTQAGGNIRQWVQEQLDLFDPLPAQDILSLAAELGAVVTELEPKPAR